MTDAPERRSVSPRSLILVAGALVVACLLLFPRRKAADSAAAPVPSPIPSRLPAEAPAPSDIPAEASPLGDPYRRPVERPRPVENPATSASREEAPPVVPESGGPASRRRDEKKTLPELFRMPADPAPKEAPAPTPAPRPSDAPRPPAIPFGRLIKCQLVETLDSLTARSEPIVALVTEDFYWDGELVIPAGTEAFSYAKPEPILDRTGVGRLVDDGRWTLVRTGSPELTLKGRALERDEARTDRRGRALAWGGNDGVDGLGGETLSTLEDRDVRLFAAAALGAMAQGFAAVSEREQPAPGLSGVLGATQVAPTLANAAVGAAGAGATEVMTQVSERIRQEIAKRGFFVRVPAGKPFYLFTEEAFDARP